MAHGFERLERLFTGSRRKGQGRQKTTKQQKTSTIASRRPSSPVFPSPPYLRPTSTHMTPRSAQIDSPEWEMSRSQSVPTLQEALHKRSSAASSLTIVNRSSRSDASASSSRPGSRDPQITSRPFRFRFPEDSLFKNNRPIRTSADSGKQGLSREQSPRSHATKPQGLLDWSPKHISLLFNPLEFKTSSSDGPWELRSSSTESTLLPSPDFAPSVLTPAGCELVDKPTPSHPSLSSRSSVKRVISNLRGRSLSSYRKPLLDPRPAPSNAEDTQKPAIHRSMSLNAMASPDLKTARIAQVNTNSALRGRQNARETWGNRFSDPQSYNPHALPHPRLRESSSTSTLSIITSQIPKDRVLQEPTFDDFYALSDDDIAESRPPSPTPPTSANDFHDCHQNSLLPQACTSQHVKIKPKRESDSPGTSTNCHLLALSYSPIKSADTLGALWAAILARKYDFTVLYVLSLWPVGGDRDLDVSPTTTTTTASKPNPAKATTMNRLAPCARKPQISGRLLAAYGLSEVPSPFEIATDTHLAALDCDRWNEYRNVDARPNDISRGWIRPFYSGYTPVSAASKAARSPPNDHPKDRGIVFAAYSKQTSSPLIPMRASQEQELLLQQLYTDAKALVDALVK